MNQRAEERARDCYQKRRAGPPLLTHARYEGNCWPVLSMGPSRPPTARRPCLRWPTGIRRTPPCPPFSIPSSFLRYPFRNWLLP